MEIDDDWWRRGKSSHNDESWDDDGDDDEEMSPRCHACGAEIFDEDTLRCPSCGAYQSQGDASPTRPRGWVIVTAIVLVFLSLYWLAKYSAPLF